MIIILILFTYLFIAGIVAGLANYMEVSYETDAQILIGVFWPLTVPVLVGVWTVVKVTELLE